MKKVKKKHLGAVFVLIHLVFILAIGNVSTATVSSGYLQYVYEDDFSTQTTHPLYPYGVSYMPEGVGKVTVGFRSYSGTGAVTFKVSSDAFVGDTTTIENIQVEDALYSFELTYSIKSDIDGRYTVHFEARNHLGEVLDMTSIRIEVWSSDHIDAADNLFLLQNRFSTGYGYMSSTGQIFDSPQGRANFNVATNEFNLALMVFSEKEWDDTKGYCQSASSYLDKAEEAEVGWSQYSISNPISYVTLMVVAVLIIIYLIVGIWRKIRPISKTQNVITS